MNFYFILIIILLLILFSLIVKNIYRYLTKHNKKYNIKKDGAIILPQILNSNEIDIFKNMIENKKSIELKNYIINSESINKKIKNILGSGYIFHDYIFIIKKSNIDTCHRDYNGSFYNKDIKHKSYTIIFYLENMDRCLDIIPKSHIYPNKNNINFSDFTEYVKCSKGDALLFDANLIHSGAYNEKQNNVRIQMKISHKDDIKYLNYYQNYNKILNKENNYPKWFNNLKKTFSCSFPIFNDWIKSYDDNTNNKHEINKETNLLSKYLYVKLDNL